jgi:hypothetical protein
VTIDTSAVDGNVVNVLGTGTITNLVGHARTTINVGNNSVLGIQGTLNIENPPSYDTINIYGRLDPGSGPIIMGNFTPAGDSDQWGYIIGLAPAQINNEYADTTSLFVATGTGDPTIDVLATSVNTTLDTDGATVNVGNAGSAQFIDGTLTVETYNLNTPNPLTIDDSADAASRHVTLGTTNFNMGTILGLAPAEIIYSLVSPVTIDGGSGGNRFDVLTTVAHLTQLNTGTGNDLVDILATVGALDITGLSGNDTVTIGSLAPSLGGTVANIQGAVTVNNALGRTALIVDDSADSTGRTATLTNSALTGLAPAAINYVSTGLSSLAVYGGNGNDTFKVGSPAPTMTVTLNGGGGANTLVGPNTTNTWQISSVNGGTLGTISFSAIQKLVGGSGVDTFKFTPSGKVASIDGGGAPAGQGDWLNYSAFPTNQPVTVNLATGSATGVNNGAPGAVSNIQNVIGGAGNDHLTGDAQGNILLGLGGNDVINGGNGRSLLIGGAGDDTIVGGTAGDIVIGGYTVFGANETALMLILKEWQRTDKSYSQRIADLKNGGGYNSSYDLIWGTTVLDDHNPDVLTGGLGLDWFFASLAAGQDRITDRNNGGTEQVN